MAKILLAEDDIFLVRAYQDGLQQAGFEVVVVRDGREIFGKTISEQPDLILLDLLMPFEGGFSALEKIKANEGAKNIPVIVLTNSALEADRKRSEELGAAEHMVKSDYSMAQVVEKVKFHLRGRL